MKKLILVVFLAACSTASKPNGTIQPQEPTPTEPTPVVSLPPGVPTPPAPTPNPTPVPPAPTPGPGPTRRAVKALLGPSTGIYSSTATVSAPADGSWSPYTAGGRLQVLQTTMVGADGSTFSAISGFYDSTMQVQCSLVAVGAVKYCLPADRTMVLRQTSHILGSTNSDCSNPKLLVFVQGSKPAPMLVVNDEQSDVHLFDVVGAPHPQAEVYAADRYGCWQVGLADGMIGYEVGSDAVESQWVDFQ